MNDKKLIVVIITIAIVATSAGLLVAYIKHTTEYIDLLEKKNTLLEDTNRIYENTVDLYKLREENTILSVIGLLEKVFAPDENSNVEILPVPNYCTYYNLSNETYFTGDIFMFYINNNGTYYFMKNAPDVFYIENISNARFDINGDVIHSYIMYQEIESNIVAIDPKFELTNR